ncbi:MAG: hypothetical protein WCI12_06040 [Actinomycetes bacterium]
MTHDDELKPDPGAPGAQVGHKHSGHRGRRVLTWVLIVAFTILTPLTLVAGWAVKTVANTDRYVATLHPLVHDPIVTNYIADQATNKLFTQFDVQQKISDALPKQVGFIAAPVTAQLHGFTDTQMRKVTSSAVFARLWDKENRFTHSTAVSVLTGQNPPTVSKARQVVVDLTPAIASGIDALDAKGVTLFNPIKGALDTNRKLSLKIFSAKQVQQASFFFDLAINLRLLLLIGTPILGLAAIAIGVNRRRTALRLILGGILGCLGLAALLTVGKSLFVHSVPVSAQVFAQHVFDALIRYLHGSLLWTLGIMVVIALGLWLAGGSAWAVALRRAVKGSRSALASTAESVRQSESAAKAFTHLRAGAAFVARNGAPLRWVGVAGAAVFILRSHSVSGVVWTLVVLAAYQVILLATARWSAQSASSPDAITTSVADAPR